MQGRRRVRRLLSVPRCAPLIQKWIIPYMILMEIARWIWFILFSQAPGRISRETTRLSYGHMPSMVMNLSLDGVSFDVMLVLPNFMGHRQINCLTASGQYVMSSVTCSVCPDLYDVDYETGGQAEHPSKWSVMASGSYLNKSRTPCGYSLFERYALGFATPCL